MTRFLRGDERTPPRDAGGVAARAGCGRELLMVASAVEVEGRDVAALGSWLSWSAPVQRAGNTVEGASVAEH